MLLRPEIGHAQVLRIVTFWVAFTLFGAEAGALHWLVLVAHLVAVALLFAVTLRLTHAPAVACVVAVWWGTCPSSEGTLGWYSVFGHTLCTIFVLVGFDLALRAAPDGLGFRRLAACTALFIAAGGGFGVGLGLAMVFPVAVWLLAPSWDTARTTMAVLFLAAGAVYFGQRAALAAVGGQASVDAVIGSLGISEPARVVKYTVQLLAYGTAALVRGPFASIIGWPTWGAEMSVVLAGGLVLLAVMVSTVEERRSLLASLLLAGAAYASVAAGRSTLMGTFRVDLANGATMLRDHYAGQAFITLVCGVAVVVLVRRVRPELERVMVVG